MGAIMELEIGPGADPGSYAVRVLQSVGAGEPPDASQLPGLGTTGGATGGTTGALFATRLTRTTRLRDAYCL